MGKNTVGFDFGESRLKIVLCDGGKIKKALNVEVPDNMMADGTIRSMDAMSDFIRETAKENGIGKENASVVLPNPYVYSKVVTIPVMTHQQVLYNLPFEFSDYLKQDKGLYRFDYMVLGKDTDEAGDVTGLQLFACAALKSTIVDFRSMLKNAGFRLMTAVPVEYSYMKLLGRAISQKYEEENKDSCIVDIGYTGTEMYIYHGSSFVQRRNLEYGMRGLAQLISERLGVDEHVARSYVISDYSHVLSSEFCLEYYDELAVEIMKTINFYNYNNREAELNRMFLSGGGTAIPQLGEKISNMTGLQIETTAAFLPDAEEGTGAEMTAAAVGCTL